MIIIKKIVDLQRFILAWKAKKKTISFVPTMGALHPGHLSLISEARNHDRICVASIFVNPTQFNNKEDFKKYPNTISADIDKLESAGCDLLFLPDLQEIYPEGEDTFLYDIGSLEKILEGAYRPGHFLGVCQVVYKLLTAVQPDILLLGRKDLQQVRVLEQMVRAFALHIKIEVVPILREESGLAMSSRNSRLSLDQKKKAVAISDALNMIKEKYGTKENSVLIENAKELLKEQGFDIDYVAIADQDTLLPIGDRAAQKNAVALIAAAIGEVRLIDNMDLN